MIWEIDEIYYNTLANTMYEKYYNTLANVINDNITILWQRAVVDSIFVDGKSGLVPWQPVGAIVTLYTVDLVVLRKQDRLDLHTYLNGVGRGLFIPLKQNIDEHSNRKISQKCRCLCPRTAEGQTADMKNNHKSALIFCSCESKK